MSPLTLSLAGLWLPPSLKKKALSDLASLTAEAFGSAPPPFDGMSWRERIEAYARYTREEARRTMLRPEELPGLRARLRENARVFAAGLKKRFGAKEREQALRLARILYRAIGIDFEAGLDGGILIRSCGFCAHYDGAVCGLVSGLDEGVLAGLLGDGRLEFRERLTEGGAACRAVFRFEEPGR